MDPKNPSDPLQQSVSHSSVGAAQPGTPAPSPQVVYVQPVGRPLMRWLSWLGWAGCLLSFLVIFGMASQYQSYFDTSGGIQEKFISGNREASDKVAIITVEGLIGTRNEFAKKQIDRVRKDDSVKAVVIRVDSPGGTITGSDYIFHHLEKLRKDREIPFVVSMGSIAASGGYYVAMAVGDEPESIFSEPTTTTGSIGVIIPHYDVSGLLRRFDVKDDSIVSHPRKQMLSMTRPISPDDRGVLEAYLQDAFVRFKDVVKSGRPAFRGDESKLDELATGEIFTAVRAQENGLVDQLGFVEDAVKRSAELANLSDHYRVVRYKAPMTLFDALTITRTQSARTDFANLLELGIPTAYYLATSLPPLVTTWSQTSSIRN